MDFRIYSLGIVSLWNNKSFNQLKFKMKTGDALSLFSQIINFVIFVYVHKSKPHNL